MTGPVIVAATIIAVMAAVALWQWLSIEKPLGVKPGFIEPAHEGPLLRVAYRAGVTITSHEFHAAGPKPQHVVVQYTFLYNGYVKMEGRAAYSTNMAGWTDRLIERIVEQKKQHQLGWDY